MRINVFIFRRDLRVADNLALARMMKRCEEEKIRLLPIFIFNPHQIDPSKNTYFSKNCVEFMIQSLSSLSQDLDDALIYLHGQDIDVLQAISQTYEIRAIGFNEDHTPFAIKRDTILKQWSQKHGIDVITAQDYTLFPIGSIVTEDKEKPYEVFTPFYHKCISKYTEIPKPLGDVSKKKILFERWIHMPDQLSPFIVQDVHAYYYHQKNDALAVKGGRAPAMMILKRIKIGHFSNYDRERDLPAEDRTTKLSAYMKFGCVSVREVFHAVLSTHGVHHGLARELIWREFYANITYCFPRVLQGQIQKTNRAFKQKYNGIRWRRDKVAFKKWCAGTTGFPLVDAAMRQMNTTGWMHNRCRMVVSMFLTKDLMIDWKMGEKYFAHTLVDYDPSSNNGGWQWSASTGVDSQPYFRIFNPFTQSKRFDPDATYIKKWIPELKDVPPEDIHNWAKASTKYKALEYPPPMVDHAVQSKKVLQQFTVALRT